MKVQIKQAASQLLLAYASFFTFNRGSTTFFHLHLVAIDSSYWYDLISFRDILRSNINLASDYYRHKLYLLKKYGNNRKKYREEKELWFDKNILGI